MNRAVVNRAVVARRAATNQTARRADRTPVGTVGTNPALRASASTSTAIRYVRRSTALKMTGAQRNSEGRLSEWSMSPEFFTDPKWSQTVTSQR